MKQDYAAQYKHPQWQKKRLESLEYADFTCEACGDKETTLHVHHKHYVKGRKIWEYDVSELEVLCEPCHEQTHALRGQLAEAVSLYDTASLPQLVALVRGFSRSFIGPSLDDEIAASDDPTDFYVGIIADLLGGLDVESQRAIGTIVLESIRRSLPHATGLHAVVERGIAAFKGYSDA